MTSTDRVNTSPFTLSAGPNTDLWRKPPSTNRTNAVYKSLGKVSLGDFDSAGVTFRASWQERYDQAGIALFFKQANGTDKWIKSGVEFYNKKPYVVSDATLPEFGKRSMYDEVPILSVRGHRSPLCPVYMLSTHHLRYAKKGFRAWLPQMPGQTGASHLWQQIPGSLFLPRLRRSQSRLDAKGTRWGRVSGCTSFT